MHDSDENTNTPSMQTARSELYEAGIPVAYIDVVFANDNPLYLARMILELHQLGIIRQDNQAAFLTHANFLIVCQSLDYLRQANMLTRQNFDVVIAHNHPHFIGFALAILQSSEILNQANVDALISTLEPIALFSSIFNLQLAGIFNQRQFTNEVQFYS